MSPISQIRIIFVNRVTTLAEVLHSALLESSALLVQTNTIIIDLWIFPALAAHFLKNGYLSDYFLLLIYMFPFLLVILLFLLGHFFNHIFSSELLNIFLSCWNDLIIFHLLAAIFILALSIWIEVWVIAFFTDPVALTLFDLLLFFCLLTWDDSPLIIYCLFIFFLESILAKQHFHKSLVAITIRMSICG